MIEQIEGKNKDLIEKAKEIMAKVDDVEHGSSHMYDVVMYTKELINNIVEEIDEEACIISAYWHDVGRIEKDEKFEQLSTKLLKEEMERLEYDEGLINKCCNIVSAKSENGCGTLEEKVVKDADKLALLAKGHWRSDLKNSQKLGEIVSMLPKLEDENLNLEASKAIYEREIIKLIEMLSTVNLDEEGV